MYFEEEEKWLKKFQPGIIFKYTDTPMFPLGLKIIKGPELNDELGYKITAEDLVNHYIGTFYITVYDRREPIIFLK